MASVNASMGKAAPSKGNSAKRNTAKPDPAKRNPAKSNPGKSNPAKRNPEAARQRILAAISHLNSENLHGARHMRRRGLLQGTWCLNPGEAMSPGQAEELGRDFADYPHLCDDRFVAANLERWLA